MNTITIREATVDDTLEIRTMHAESWLATYPNDEHNVPYEWVKNRTNAWITPENIEESKRIIARNTTDPEHFYRIAEQNGKIIGFIHASIKDDETNELNGLYVTASVIGKGVGAQLMTIADIWLAGRETILTVITYNQRAKAFYKKHGFKEVQGSEHTFAEIMPVINMVRPAKKVDNDEKLSTHTTRQ